MDIATVSHPVSSLANGRKDIHANKQDHFSRTEDKVNARESGDGIDEGFGRLNLGQIRSFIAKNVASAIAQGKSHEMDDSVASEYGFDSEPSPIAVINHILNAARRVLESLEVASSDETETAPIEEVQNQVAASFANVEETLETLSALTEQVRSELQTIQEAVSTQLHQPLFEGSKSESVAMGAYEAFSAASRTSIEIMTQDGDMVTIDLARRTHIDSTYTSQYDGSGRQAGFEMGILKDQELHIRVQGDLDEEELKAIEEVVQNINRLTHDYALNGIEQGLDLSAQLEMNADQLAQVSFEHQTTAQYRAVSMYESMQNAVQEEPVSSETNARPQELLAVLSEFVQKVRTVIEDMKANTPFVEPRETAFQILEAMFAFKGNLNEKGDEANDETRVDLTQLEKLTDEVVA